MLYLVLILSACFGFSQAVNELCYAGGTAGKCQAGTGCSGGLRSFPLYCAQLGGARTCCVPPLNCNPNPEPSGDVVPVKSLAGQFGNPDKYDPRTVFCGPLDNSACSGIVAEPGVAQIRWGTPARGMSVEQSGLGFVARTLTRVAVNQTFTLGTFYHYNFVIEGDSNIPTLITLQMRMQIDGMDRPIVFNFRLTMDETANKPGQCAYTIPGADPNNADETPPCPDRIGLVNGGFANILFQIPNSNGQYTLQILGFRQRVCDADSTTDTFTTNEKVVNAADILAMIRVACTCADPNTKVNFNMRGICECIPVPPGETNAPTRQPQPTPIPNSNVVPPSPSDGGRPPSDGNMPPTPANPAFPTPGTPGTPGGPPSPPGTPGGPPGPPSPSTPGGGAITGESDPNAGSNNLIPIVAGAVGGAIVVLAILAALGYFLMKKGAVKSPFAAQRVAAEHQIADNPLYHKNQVGGSNPLYNR